MPHNKKRPPPNPPKVIRDKTTFLGGHTKIYDLQKFLGKGGFARVFSLKSRDTGNIYAGKCVWKQHIHNRSTARKLIHEIEIHSKLEHQHVVKMERHFEDDDFVYILLELCENYSLMELMKTRGHLTEPEVRYFLLQIIDAVTYLHKKNIIHRDLKLGNLLLDTNMNIKLADFGLATQLVTENEKRTTICGTPNYIAPEVLHGSRRGGHSFEVDVWSLGVIMFTLLCGKPPFETSNLEKTYLKIRRTDYKFPPNIFLSPQSKDLVTKILVKQATQRPSMDALHGDPFFHLWMPTSIPLTALIEPPNFETNKSSSSASSSTSNRFNNNKNSEENNGGFKFPEAKQKNNSNFGKRRIADQEGSRKKRSNSSMEKHLRDIHRQMENSFNNEKEVTNPPANSSSKRRPENSEREPMETEPPSDNQFQHKRMDHITKKTSSSLNRKFGENITRNKDNEKLKRLEEKRMGGEPPPSSPKVWVLCWLVCKRYGVGYVLSNSCFGVFFNDYSKIVLQPDKKSYCYIERGSGGHESRCEGIIDNPPNELRKKVLLLVRIQKHISSQRNIRLVGSTDCLRAEDILYVKGWEANENATLFRLSNKLIQVNYHEDNSELLVCPDTRTCTYTDHQKQKKTILLDDVKRKYPEIQRKLQVAKELLNK